MKLRLTVEATYELNGTDPKFLKDCLNAIVEQALDEGLFTRASDAELGTVHVEIEENDDASS